MPDLRALQQRLPFAHSGAPSKRGGRFAMNAAKPSAEIGTLHQLGLHRRS